MQIVYSLQIEIENISVYLLLGQKSLTSLIIWVMPLKAQR